MYIGIAELQGRNGWLSMQLPYQYLFPLYLYIKNIYVDGTLYTLSLPLFPHSAIYCNTFCHIMQYNATNASS